VELNVGSLAQVVDDPQYVWNVTLRNGRKRKKYNRVPSKLLGIFNQSNGNYWMM
jgi:hypothetical protein